MERIEEDEMADIEKITDGAKNVAKKVADGDGPLSKPVGLAVAGAALAAIPLVAEKLAGGRPKLAEKAGDLAEGAKSKVKSELADTAKEAMPDSPGEMLGGGPLKKLFGSSDDGSDDSSDEDGEGRAAPGHGSGRRMPIQQAVDVAAPVKEVFNHWTEYEDWPDFMHRIEGAEQVDDCTVSFQAKMWGITKRFEAEIVEQRPDERIEWNVTEGYAHTGVVTFHPLSDNLTRIELSLDIEPANIIDKASRGMRFAKRAVRGDLHRFKAYAELDHEEKEGSRKTIEDGEVKRKGSSSRGGSTRSSNGSNRSTSSRSKSRSKS
jgi:uncharacterized membrane protein